MTAYCADTDLDLTFGASNITKWADADNTNDSVKITARKLWARNRATNHINTKLRKTIYTVPFASPPQELVDMTAQLAGVLLFQSPRGIVDGEEINAQMQSLRDEVDDWIKGLQSNTIRLDVTIDGTNGPGVVNDVYIIPYTASSNNPQ